MSTRSTRNQPFCWQEKKVLRLLRKEFDKTELIKYRNLYLTITEIDSDFNGKEIKFYTKTISKYSGLSREWIPKALKVFEALGIIKIIETKENGKFTTKSLLFTPNNIIEIPPKTVIGKTVNGKTVVGDPTHKKIVYKEDSLLKEENTYIVLFDFWNELDIIKHRTPPANGKTTFKTAAKKILKHYSVAEIKQAMENYARIVKSPEYEFSYRWTVTEFLVRGFEKFKDWSVASKNYKWVKQQRYVSQADLNMPKRDENGKLITGREGVVF